MAADDVVGKRKSTTAVPPRRNSHPQDGDVRLGARVDGTCAVWHASGASGARGRSASSVYPAPMRGAHPHARRRSSFPPPPPHAPAPGTRRGGRVVEEAQGEAHVPAQQPSPGEAARVPTSHVDPRRPGDRSVPPPARPGEALGLTWRVRDRATFEALRREGRRARRGALSVTFVPATGGPPRFAYGIGRRVGPAVARNRVRRRLRAAARELAGPPPGLPPGAYLVTVSPQIVGATYDELRRGLGEACAAATAAAPPAAPARPAPGGPS